LNESFSRQFKDLENSFQFDENLKEKSNLFVIFPEINNVSEYFANNFGTFHFVEKVTKQ